MRHRRLAQCIQDVAAIGATPDGVHGGIQAPHHGNIGASGQLLRHAFDIRQRLTTFSAGSGAEDDLSQAGQFDGLNGLFLLLQNQGHDFIACTLGDVHDPQKSSYHQGRHHRHQDRADGSAHDRCRGQPQTWRGPDLDHRRCGGVRGERSIQRGVLHG
ncbi:MAG: hypothetical protein WCZ23_04630 [Rhodospirillaceae bacterium]